jgi:pimeloyl-ACP methyl ester carboxylesterase
MIDRDALVAERDPDPAQFVPGSYGCHEALHVALLAAESVDAWLINHPAIAARPDWLGLAQKACDTLLELYDAVALKHLAATPEPGEPPADSGAGA